jgi:uncharacterized protein YecE (DUF72 family)
MIAHIYIGTAGWSYQDWKSTVYPEDPEPSFDELTYISSYFDTVELNNTFYRAPNMYMSKNWVKKTTHNPDFKFTAKLWQKFTHEKESFTDSDVKLFKDGINPLFEHNKLGALLIQYPWSFKHSADNVHTMGSVIDTFKEYPLVVEFRHNSWMNQDVLSLLQEKAVGFCNIDQPIIGDSIKPSEHLTSDIGYIRLHGRNYKDWFRKDAGRDDRYNYLYTDKELEAWVEKIRNMKDKAREIYVIANNHYRGQAPANALQMKAMLTNNKIDIPETLSKIYPFLKEIQKTND